MGIGAVGGATHRTVAMRKTLPFLTVSLLLIGLVGSAFATTIIDKPTYFASSNGSYITFGSSLLPLTFSTLYRGSDGYWNFNSTKIKTTIDLSVTVFCSGNWTNYTISGVGTQDIYNGSKPNAVYLDGILRVENNGWTYSSGITTVTNALSTVALNWGPPPAPETDWYWFVFTHRDLNGGMVDSYVTWQLLNDTTSLSYVEGSDTLLVGTYTLKTYYLDNLINSTSLDTATYGDSIITINLQMKAHTSVSSGYIAFNNTVTAITVNSQTISNLTFTVTGTGSFSVVVGVPNNYTYILKGASNLTGWLYDSATYPDKIRWNSSSLTATYQMIVSSPAASEDDVSFQWPDWTVYLPNFSLNIYTTLMLLGALPLIVAMMYVVALFLRGTFPPIFQLVEVVGVLAMVSFLTLALVPVITAILEGYGFG